MKDVVKHVSATIPIALDEVDISSDPELEARYGLEIPVLLIDGKKAAKYRLTEAELTRMLSRRGDEAGGTDKAGR